MWFGPSKELLNGGPKRDLEREGTGVLLIVERSEPALVTDSRLLQLGLCPDWEWRYTTTSCSWLVESI